MRSTDQYPALREGDVFLNPGEMHCGFAPARVWTILGSCVSVIVWHKRLKFGGMSHFLLPERLDKVTARRVRLDPRYGVDACKLMYAAMQRAGAKPEQCKARIFGGSHMLVKGKPSADAIGHRNAAVAHDFLERHGIELVSESLFGADHRRVHFDFESGRVWESISKGAHGRTTRKSGHFP